MSADGDQQRDVVVVAATARATATAHAPTVTISTPFWRYWLDIAIAQLEEAARSRAQGVRMKVEGGDFGTAMIAETRAAMIAAVASAACIESFYKTAASLSGYDPAGGGPAARAAFTVLSRSFGIERAGLGDQLKTLFDERNEAIHSGETDDPTEPHPLGVSTGKGNASFTVERAAKAVSLAASLLSECVAAVRSGEEFALLARRMEAHREAIQDRAEWARAVWGGEP